MRISFVIIGVRGEGKIGGMFSRCKSVRLAYICKHMPSVTTEKSPSPFGEYPGYNDLNGLFEYLSEDECQYLFSIPASTCTDENY